MTERQYEVGQEVWLRGTINSVSPITFHTNSFSAMKDVLTEADFKDPLDKAIVRTSLVAAPQLADYLECPTAATQLWFDAVQAKLDSQRPKTAEEVVMDGIDEYDRLRPGTIWRREIEAEHVVSALRSAGLLKEETE